MVSHHCLTEFTGPDRVDSEIAARAMAGWQPGTLGQGLALRHASIFDHIYTWTLDSDSGMIVAHPSRREAGDVVAPTGWSRSSGPPRARGRAAAGKRS
jgi:hypothetical protein